MGAPGEVRGQGCRRRDPRRAPPSAHLPLAAEVRSSAPGPVRVPLQPRSLRPAAPRTAAGALGGGLGAARGGGGSGSARLGPQRAWGGRRSPRLRRQGEKPGGRWGGRPGPRRPPASPRRTRSEAAAATRGAPSPRAQGAGPRSRSWMRAPGGCGFPRGTPGQLRCASRLRARRPPG